MKTFETEKGNIPEGATHYSDETEVGCFAWYKVIHNVPFIWCVGYEELWVKMIKPCEFELDEVRPTPQTKEVEWVNGDECNYGGVDALVVGYCSDSSWIVIEHSGEIESVNVMRISKPETEQQREERERLENGKSLHAAASKTEEATTHGIFRLWEMEDKETRNHYCQLAELIGHKANYRISK